MNCIISYSRTGTNERLATEIATGLSLNHYQIQEVNASTYFRITIDLVFNRMPKIITPDIPDHKRDLLILISPVWFGKIAFPMRSFLKQQKGKINQYIFISLSGGGDGPDSNPKLSSDLTKRTEKEPLAVINKHIADFLPQDPKPTPKEIENYAITERDYEIVTKELTNKIKQIIADKLN